MNYKATEKQNLHQQIMPNLVQNVPVIWVCIKIFHRKNTYFLTYWGAFCFRKVWEIPPIMFFTTTLENYSNQLLGLEKPRCMWWDPKHLNQFCCFSQGWQNVDNSMYFSSSGCLVLHCCTALFRQSVGKFPCYWFIVNGNYSFLTFAVSSSPFRYLPLLQQLPFFSFVSTH